MNKLSLFSGVGGLDLAAKWAGFNTVAFCEQNKFCQRVLGKHWPTVPIISDIREVTKERLTREGINVNTIKLVTGGFPCQPFSVAGEQRGAADDRYLWPEMLRVISEIRPPWVVGENVSGIISMALDRVCSDLEDQGYEVEPILIPACSIGARHKRERVFILAHFNGVRMEGCTTKSVSRITDLPQRQSSEFLPYKREVTDAFEPKLCRSAHRLPYGVDRLRALGNAVVPQQAFPIFAGIAAIEGIK